MATEKDIIIEKIKTLIVENGSHKKARVLLTMMGSIPVAGGSIAAVGSAWSEKEQGEINKIFLEFAEKTESDLKAILLKLEPLINPISKDEMKTLMVEIIGREGTERLLSEKGNAITIVLHDLSTEELRPYEKLGWISIQSTHSTATMGAGNKVGNKYEDLKRSYGNGTCFVIASKDTYFL